MTIWYFSWGKLNFRFEADSFNLIRYILEMMLSSIVYTVTTNYMSKVLDFLGGMFFHMELIAGI